MVPEVHAEPCSDASLHAHQLIINFSETNLEVDYSTTAVLQQTSKYLW